jgi:dTDP-4-dehydrorhamnose reductase
MKILLIGASGMLGQDLVREWTQDEMIGATSRDADIRNAHEVNALVSRVGPDWVVLTAAFTDVDGSEKQPEQAFAVNAQGAENVARAARESGARLLFVSTDYVFDGKTTRPYEPNDAIAPLNVYGESKAAGERAVQKHGADWCIARTSWLFGASGASFPEKILRAAETRPELTVVSDQVGSPTYTRDLACAIRDLVHSETRGIVNVTNAGSCSWFEFAKEILRQAGRNSVRVLPISTEQAGRLAKRPAYSILSPTSLEARGITLRDWREATAAYLSELRALGRLA